MSDTILSQEDLNKIFSLLDAGDIDQFYHGYQLWRFQQRIAELREQIDALERQLAINREEMQQATPSPIAQASLALLQSHGVEDPDLLDRLLERGDEWLDRTIQHLQYCEQADLIGDGYTKWCEHALEGAYDWIDSMTGADSAASALQAEAPLEAEQEIASEGEVEIEIAVLPETTEAMLLQKLMSEEDTEDELTLKLAAVPTTPVLAEEHPASSEIPVEEAPAETIEKPDQHAQEEERSSGEITGPADETQANEAQQPAPNERYEFPDEQDETVPAESEAALAHDDPAPSAEETAVPEAEAAPMAEPQPVVTAIWPPASTPRYAAPPARPQRKRSFWQKLFGR